MVCWNSGFCQLFPMYSFLFIIQPFYYYPSDLFYLLLTTGEKPKYPLFVTELPRFRTLCRLFCRGIARKSCNNTILFLLPFCALYGVKAHLLTCFNDEFCGYKTPTLYRRPNNNCLSSSLGTLYRVFEFAHLWSACSGGTWLLAYISLTVVGRAFVWIYRAHWSWHASARPSLQVLCASCLQLLYVCYWEVVKLPGHFRDYHMVIYPHFHDAI